VRQRMWLKVSFSLHNLRNYNFDDQSVSVELLDGSCIPVSDPDGEVRLSPIFPLVEETSRFSESSYEIRFFEFSDPFRVLGRINQYGSERLKNQIYFSCGACAILLFSEDAEVVKDLELVKLPEPKAQELWIVKDGLIESATFEPDKSEPPALAPLKDYSALPLALRTIVDEFLVSIHLIASKTHREEAERIRLIDGLVKRIDGFIGELLYLYKPEGEPPKQFWAANADISQPLVRDLYIQQIVDRLIQINSALSYVSTQMHSGSIPILERRSLIRRSSLLGIGSAVRTLDRIVAFIESAFRKVNFESIIRTQLHGAKPLPGTDDLTFPDRKQWLSSNIGKFENGMPLSPPTQKLAYFSSRYGFRESEFAITAALNSLWNGLSLEWSVMTITHEMLHSHVRLLLSFLFLGSDISEEDNYRSFYERFYAKVIENKRDENYSLLDSIRELIFGYCLRSQTAGSISVIKPFVPAYKLKAPKDYSAFYPLLRDEYRNINEILVHVLDLHYFYGGRVTKYIPLIWCSWSAVPNVRADLRQYILRSLLTLASKTNASESNASELKRFEFAVEDFKSILAENEGLLSRFPLLDKVRNILSDKDLKRKYYNPFVNSLILVDLAKEILFSKTVAAALSDDIRVSLSPAEDKAETEFAYSMPPGFYDDNVDSPMSYLFDRMLRVLRGEFDPEQEERDITTVFLAMNAR
jgi:hypothetical protein